MSSNCGDVPGRARVLQQLEPSFLLLPILGRVAASATVKTDVDSAK
jgi:hypothetical protein